MAETKNRQRQVFPLVMGVLFGPLAVIPLTVVLFYIWVYLPPSVGSVIDTAMSAISDIVMLNAAMISAPFYAYVLVLFYGLPVYIWLRKHGKNNLINTLLMGQIPVLPLQLLFTGKWQWPAFFILALYAAVVSISCWLIVCLFNKKNRKYE